jgi:hypothetical protein
VPCGPGLAASSHRVVPTLSPRRADPASPRQFGVPSQPATSSTTAAST